MATVNLKNRALKGLRENNEDAQRLIEISARQNQAFAQMSQLNTRITRIHELKQRIINHKTFSIPQKQELLNRYDAELSDIEVRLSIKREEYESITKELSDFQNMINEKRKLQEATAPATVPEVGCLGASCGLWGGRRNTRRHKKVKKAKKTRSR